MSGWSAEEWSPRAAHDLLRRPMAGQDSGHKVEVRRRVIQALVYRTTPDTRSAALIALLHTIRHEPKIIYPRYAMWSQMVDWPGLNRP